MKRNTNSLVALCLLTLVGTASAQTTKPKTEVPVAGTVSTTIGVTVEEVSVVATGWSIKKQLIGKVVYNDKNEKLGKMEDVIVAGDKSLSYAILGVGGFLGLAKHDVAIPINQIKLDKDRLILPGATKEVLKAMPEFQYAKEPKT